MLASQALLSEKYLRPQFTTVSVAVMTLESAVVSCDHFELVPQPPRPLQGWSLSSLPIDPDLSWTMSTSGGEGMTGLAFTPQVVVPPPPVTSPPPPLRPTPVMTSVPPPLPPFPEPDEFPELAALPLVTPSPAGPGLKPQAAKPTEINANFTKCPFNQRIMGPPTKGGCPDVRAIAYARSLKKMAKNVPT